jgi:hypothetical protein
LLHRAAGCFHAREHGVGSAVQNRYDARDAIAGQALNRAHDWHGAADRGLETQLTALAGGERPERRSMAGNELLVCGDDRFACKERGACPRSGRLDPADCLDHDVDIARQDVIDAIGPDDSAGPVGREPVAFLVRPAIEDVGESETANCVGGEPPGDGRSDRTESEETDTTARSGWEDGGGFVEIGAWAVTGRVKRIDGHVSFLISPPSSA